MEVIAVSLFCVLMTLILCQGLLVLGFVLVLRTWKRTLITDERAPKAAVILCLRGEDPFLDDCIRGLLVQDYPAYDLHVIIDHPDDPAHAVLRRLLKTENAANVHIQFLEKPRNTCSLYCSSVVQVVQSLDDSYGFIAQLDADTVPHPGWLRELATALDNEHVGGVTGNRWYMPQNTSWGSLVRYIWNAAAVVQMYWYKIAWGGTVAVKMSVFEQTDLLEQWSHSLCGDTLLYPTLKKAGMRLAFVPSLMMVNREKCDLGGYYYWVRRQLLNMRLYHPAWILVVGLGAVTTIAPMLALLLLVGSLVTGNTMATYWSVAGILSYQAAITLIVPVMEIAVHPIVKARNESTRWLTLVNCLKYVLAMPLTQIVYAVALTSTCRLRRVDWRGIAYRIDGPQHISMVKYGPFVPEKQEDSPLSL